MRPNRSLALAALPGAAAVALWGGYRHAVHLFSADRATPAHLPGNLRTVNTDWGRLSYRYVAGSNPGPPLMLIHGWGSAADPVWWQLIQHTERTVVAIDLPGHGRSTLNGRFSFSIASNAVKEAAADAGLRRPVLVGHSMGGPVALTALNELGAESFAGFVAIATSAYWVRPRHQVMVAAAPYVLGPGSPIVTGAMRAEAKSHPDLAEQVAKAYAMRPNRRVLIEAAAELRRFDAREWKDLRIPPAVWIVTSEDGIVPADDQRASAVHFGIPSIELTSDHPAVTRAPMGVAEIIERLF